jgi:hypothetical protein
MFSWLWGSSNDVESGKPEKSISENPIYKKVVDLENLKVSTLAKIVEADNPLSPKESAEKILQVENSKKIKRDEFERISRVVRDEKETISAEAIDKVISHLSDKYAYTKLLEDNLDHGKEYLFDQINRKNKTKDFENDKEILSLPENRPSKKMKKSEFKKLKTFLDESDVEVCREAQEEARRSYNEREGLRKIQEEKKKNLEERSQQIKKLPSDKIWAAAVEASNFAKVNSFKSSKIDNKMYTPKLEKFYGNIGGVIYEQRMREKAWRDKRSAEAQNELEGIGSLERVSARPEKTMKYLENRSKFSLSMRDKIANSSNGNEIERILLEGKGKRKENFTSKVKKESSSNDLSQH